MGYSRSLLFLSLVLNSLLSVFGDLQSELSGKGFDIVFPTDAGYTNASQAFNLRFDFQPAAVAFPITPKHISELVKIGAKYTHQVAARSGGHSYIANGLGGKNGVLVVDMRNFVNINVDAISNTAIIGTGSRLGDIALTLNNNGRALPHGTCPFVGIGGHSGFGGYGFTSRKWGLTLDTIMSLNVVLADGTITTASEHQNPDLFWAMRGASPSYGIVTSLQVKTFAAPPSVTVFEYHWNLNITDAAKALGTFQDYVQTNVPQEFGADLILRKGLAKGEVTFGLTGGYYGPADEVNNTLAPFLDKVPKPGSFKLTVGSYIDTVNYLGRHGTLNTTTTPDSHDTFYAKSLIIPENSPLSTQTITAFVSFLANEGFESVTQWFVDVELYGGTNSAINQVAPDTNAFAHRHSLWTFQFYASSPNLQPPYPQSGFEFLDDMVQSILDNSPPDWDIGAYPNYIDDRLNNWQELYFGQHYRRLQEIKDSYDPDSVFSFPTSVQVY